MSIFMEKKDDGSLAFFLDGDLQFDSNDEYIYHEGLAIPALTVAQSRCQRPLKALIIGGGDGLTARELLKSARISSVDLVDYDQKVVNLACTEFSTFNQNSFADGRLKVSIEDAREFIKRALQNNLRYDLIISDLTASHDADGAQLHTVEFYKSLAQILTSEGALAVNTASPSGTPQAYWSIFNSILASGLNPRAYRIFLPSFAEQGYGLDWGFVLASPRPIESAEFDALSALAVSGRHLTDVAQMQNMFYLPQSILEQQEHAFAASGDSDILVHYMFNAQPIAADSSALVNTLGIDLADLNCRVQSTSTLLPATMQQKFGDWEIEGDQSEQSHQTEQILAEIFELMPALQRHQTREMLQSFMEKPAAFLAPINLESLVDSMLKRASELPGKMADELKFLKEKIVAFAGDQEKLLALGLRSMAIIAVVVILGNLIYPDSAYAKGHHSHGYGRNGGSYYGGSTTYYNNGHWGPWYTNSYGKRTRKWVH